MKLLFIVLCLAFIPFNHGLALLNGTMLSSEKNEEIVELSIRGSSGSMGCSGSYVGPNTIITAGHCLFRPSASGGKINVYVNGKLVKVKTFMIHPEFKRIAKTGKINSVNDVGIIILRSDVTNKFLSIAKGKPLKDEQYKAISVGPTSKDSKKLGDVNSSCDYSPLTEMGGLTFVKGLLEDGIAILHGDSGSALLNSKGQLVGIASEATPNGISFRGEKAMLSTYSATYDPENIVFIRSSLKHGAKIPSL